jgi:hypothetical protein
MRENTYIERTFVLPNDKLSVYQDVIDNGIFNFSDNKTHHVEIILADVKNNKSSLDFNVISKSPSSSPASPPEDKSLIVMPFDRTSRFRAQNITITVPAGALYDTLFFSYKKDSGTSQMLSDVHYVHNKYTPVQKAYSLSIKPTMIPTGKESKLLIVQLSDDFKKSALPSTMINGFVTAEALSFGMFYVGIDTVAPVISANGLLPGANMTGKSQLRIRITDDLSGIKAYEPSIDGKWALFEYDQKNDVLIYKFDSKRITQGTIHSLTLKLTDNKDNQSFYNCDFTW